MKLPYGNVSHRVGQVPQGVVTPLLYTYDFIANPSMPAELSVSRSSSGTYIDTSGIRNTASSNVARFDCDWSGSAFTQRGLLVEDSRTNIISSDSENPGTGFNNVNNCSWSTSSTVGADNSTNMSTLTASAGFPSHGTSQLIFGTHPSFCDIEFKKTNWNYVYVNLIPGGGNSYTAVFDLVNGIVTEDFAQGASVGSGPAHIRRLRNGIYRCGIITNQDTGYFDIGLAQVATGNSFTSVGEVTGTNWAGTETVLVGSYMIETVASGSYHSSHIASSGAAHTRSADIVSASGTLSTQLSAGPSVWEMEDLSTGTISRTQYAAGAFTFPTNQRYRSFGVYQTGTNTAPYTTVGGPYS